ncbi:LacI family DNA-binding transcriptional regulator [Demequina sp. SYSU T00192]|uniref:LacI family DNA-binding transcriptional regulator n=1 Tax=Demequina litoralis TaxID=3051660 RepID=A0ABT8GCL6_9MICO|nr:LacI family DNA-binding transcriptional regulator [Demequina sp. SYSU T00192]MDN4476880.1 LacI family DNA-binding transcriptional regulator [Demequina sp. SYSU T00192]
MHNQVTGEQPQPTVTRIVGASGRPTIREVAQVAGVSRGTVSRYLNGQKWVGADSATAIRQAIDTTGYSPNREARSLASGRATTVVFLLTASHEDLFNSRIYSMLMSDISNALLERGMSLVLMTACNAAERAAALEFVRGGSVHGVMLLASRVGDPLIGHLAAAGVRTVCCGRPMAWESQVSSSSADDRTGGREATALLAAEGRSRIGIITGPLGVGGAVDRLEGYLEALDAAHLPRDMGRVIEGDWTRDSGRAGAEALLAADPSLDAVFASNDSMAAGAIDALRAAGRSVPHDVSVVGFDDSGLAATLDPPLTTLRQPFAAIGREMVRLLLEQPADQITHTTHPAQLVVRGSTRGES